MSEIKPTPGPWAVARMTPCRVDTASGSISISWSSNNDSGAREREAEANARLIAAAPELLEALQKMLPELRGLSIVSDTAAEMLREAEAAIAKATGEQT